MCSCSGGRIDSSCVTPACGSYALPSVPRHFFFNVSATTVIYTLSLHDALPTSTTRRHERNLPYETAAPVSTCLATGRRSEEHTSELQSRENLVCRLLLEKKNLLVVQDAETGEQIFGDTHDRKFRKRFAAAAEQR